MPLWLVNKVNHGLLHSIVNTDKHEAPTRGDGPTEHKIFFNKKRIAIFAANVILLQNVDVLSTYHSFMFAGGDFTPEIAGCEYEDNEEVTSIQPSSTAPSPDIPTPTTTNAPSVEIADTTTTTLVDLKKEKANEARSSADNNSILKTAWNVLPHYIQKNSQYAHPELDFVSRHSGMNIEIYNTGEELERVIDPEAFDDLFHLTLTADIEYMDPKMEFVMDCVENKVLEDKELAGNTVKILIPSTRDYCIDNIKLIRVDNPYKNSCTQIGGALPEIEVEFLFWKMYHEQPFVITAGDINAVDSDDLSHEFNLLVFHEALHRMMYDLGLNPRMHPDERHLEYVELYLDQALQPPVYGPPAPGRFGFSAKHIINQGVKIDIPEAVQFIDE